MNTRPHSYMRDPVLRLILGTVGMEWLSALARLLCVASTALRFIQRLVSHCSSHGRKGCLSLRIARSQRRFQHPRESTSRGRVVGLISLCRTISGERQELFQQQRRKRYTTTRMLPPSLIINEVDNRLCLPLVKIQSWGVELWPRSSLDIARHDAIDVIRVCTGSLWFTILL